MGFLLQPDRRERIERGELRRGRSAGRRTARKSEDGRWSVDNTRDGMLQDGGGIQKRGKQKCLVAQVAEDPKGTRADFFLNFFSKL
jgi:hypothetical protein